MEVENKGKKENHFASVAATEEKIVGYWFNEKKSLKFGVIELRDACRKRNMQFKKIDLDIPLEAQGSFDLILHKLTAVYAPALSGDAKAIAAKKMVEEYVESHKSLIMIDSLCSVQKLLLRAETYDLLQRITQYEDIIFTPPFQILNSCPIEHISHILRISSVDFPIVCKPLHGGGGKDAHQMAVIFSDCHTHDCPLPCLAQSFINHSAVLYKLYVLGQNWFATVRPSLKNFYPGSGECLGTKTFCSDHPSIYFNSHQVSKPDSCSPLTRLDVTEEVFRSKADLNIMQRIVLLVNQAFHMELFGIDVVMETSSGKYGIIDVNPFPSFDSVPHVMDQIAQVLRNRIDHSKDKNCIEDSHFAGILDQCEEYFVLTNDSNSSCSSTSSSFDVSQHTEDIRCPRSIEGLSLAKENNQFFHSTKFLQKGYV